MDNHEAVQVQNAVYLYPCWTEKHKISASAMQLKEECEHMNDKSLRTPHVRGTTMPVYRQAATNGHWVN